MRDADLSASRAIESARGTTESSAMTCGYAGRCIAARETGDLDTATDFGRRAVRIADEDGGEARQRHPRIWLASALIAADELDEAEQTLLVDQKEANQLGTAWSQPLWHYQRAALRLALGQLDGADAEATVGLRKAEQLTAPAQNIKLRGVLARVALHRGDFHACRTHIEEAQRLVIERNEQSPSVLAWTSALLADTESDPHGALAALSGFLHGNQRTRLIIQEPQAVPYIVDLAVRAGATDESRELVAASRALAEKNPRTALLNATSRHAEGVLRGDLATLRAAVREYGSSPRRLAGALAMEHVAAAEDEAGQREEAVTLTERALEGYTACGAPREAQRARQRLRELGADRQPPEGSSGTGIGWADLTAAELRVARLVAQGFTNREVAKELFVSPHTVDSHLRKSFSKLGVISRVELTRHVLANDTPSASGPR